MFQRFALMRYWHPTQGLPFNAFLSKDELHMSDWSYGCIAKLLAGAIAEAATRALGLRALIVNGTTTLAARMLVTAVARIERWYFI